MSPKSCSFADENKSKEENEERNSYMCDASHRHLCNSTKREIPDIRSFRRLSTDGKDSIKADKEAEIQAVTVTGHRPMYKMRNDALVTRVRNTPLAKEPTLEDVLKHIPGMKQTSDGTLEVNGLGAPTIYLNDKKATSAELSHLDVKLIDEIELITTPGAKYDATTGAVLRILTRRTDEGIFGKMQVYDKLSEVNTNHEELTLGWVTKKISLTGFYGYTDNRYNVHQPQEALVRAKDGEYLFGTDRYGKNKANYNATELNFDWLLSKQHEVGIQWEGLWLNGGRSEKQQQYYRYPNPAGEDTNREMKLSDADGEMKYFDAESQQWGHQRSHHFNLFHLAKWSKHLSSQIYLDYARNKDSDSQPITEKEGSEMQETLNRSNSNYDIYSGRIEVKQLISDKHSIIYGGEWSLMEGKGNTESSADMLGTTEYKTTIPRRQLTCNIRVKLADGTGGQASDMSISPPDTPICRKYLPIIWSVITTNGFHRSVSLSTNHRGITRSASALPPPDLLSVS